MVFLKEVNSELGHASLANNNGDTSLGELLNETLELVLLTCGVVKEIVSVLEQDGTLGFTLLHLNVWVGGRKLGVFE